MGKIKITSAIMMLSVIGLVCIGLITIHSATQGTRTGTMMWRQLIWVGMGVAMGGTLMFMPLEWLCKWSNRILFIIGLLLFYLFICVILHKVLGPDFVSHMPLVSGEKKGSFRWLQFKSITLQPSEFAKVALILFLGAYYGTKSRAEILAFKTGILYPAGFLAFPVIALIALGKDASTTAVTAAAVLGMMFCAGIRKRYVCLIILLGILGLGLMIATSPERLSRITAIQQTDAGQQNDDNYQLRLSKMALGSGGMTGSGLSQSIMKKGYLPEKHTDFILAIWGEEMGFCGITIVFLLYIALVSSILCMAMNCYDRVGMLICLGTAFLISIQALLNIGVITGFLPTTGVTAPFVSYGGSSMLSLLLCIGLVGNICRRTLNSAQQNAVNPPCKYLSFEEKMNNANA